MSDDQELVKAGLQTAFQPFADLIQKIAGPAAEEIGLTLQDRVKVFRLHRRVRLIKRTKEMMEEAGMEPKQVPMKQLAAIFDGASLVENDDLQDRWAALLANNAAGNYLKPSSRRFCDNFPLRMLTSFRNALGLSSRPPTIGGHPRGLPMFQQQSTNRLRPEMIRL